MEFLELVKKRQSVRKYDSRPVDQEVVARCLEAARLAPSASNSQPWTFIVIDDPEIREKVANRTYDSFLPMNKFVPQAPVLIVLVIEKPRVITRIGGYIKNKEYPLIDIGIAAEHICLQAESEGLGTCMLGWFNEKPIKKILNIPPKKTIGLIITLGYAPSDYRVRDKSRKSFEEAVKYNSY
ncbi:MAG: nitroreductase family protein [Bacteroidales bacterium]